MKLIDKFALVAEIEKLVDEIYAGRPFDSLSSEQQTALWYVKSIMSSINTLEVKEVDNTPNIRFPHYKSIVEKVFGTCNLESFEYDKDMLGAIEYCIKNNRPLEKEHIFWLEKQSTRNSVEFPSRIVKGNTYLCTKELKFKERPLGAYAYFKAGSFYKAMRDLHLVDEHNCEEVIDGDRLKHFILAGKSVNRFKPKFNVGDYVVDNCGYLWKIEGIINQFYILECVEGGESRPTIEWVDKTFHLWTIRDAKKGDVLATDDGICIFDGTLEEGKYPFAYCGITKRGFDSYDVRLPFSHDNNIHPATKEQRDLLFQKMKESGYEWDTEKLELKKVEQKPIGWNREDEQNLNTVLSFIDDECLRRWLKDTIHTRYDKLAK